MLSAAHALSSRLELTPWTQAYPLLEVHRRLMRLEHFVMGKSIPVESIAHMRIEAMAARKYVLIDPITLCFPMILGHLRGAFAVQENAGFRLQALMVSLIPLVRWAVPPCRCPSATLTPAPQVRRGAHPAGAREPVGPAVRTGLGVRV